MEWFVLERSPWDADDHGFNQPQGANAQISRSNPPSAELLGIISEPKICPNMDGASQFMWMGYKDANSISNPNLTLSNGHDFCMLIFFATGIFTSFHRFVVTLSFFFPRYLKTKM